MASKAKQTKTSETEELSTVEKMVAVNTPVEVDATPTPEPNKGVEPGSPEFDWHAEYPGEAVFVYTSSDGVTVGLAALAGKRKPKSGFLRKLRKEQEMEQMWTILELVSSQAALDVSDEFEDADYAAMYNQWAEWSKTTVGGILALIDTLAEHRGAVQRDLLDKGLRYDDELGAEDGRPLSFSDLATWVTYAPPNTAIFHARSEGWTRGDHFAALSWDELRWLTWSKTEDAMKPAELQEFRPTPTPRPGVEYAAPEPVDDGKLTVADYLQAAGFSVQWGEDT
ncbi:tail assembly chaperone [Mycobacterium Phage Nergal]|nr:tail assembly chaperone [Mycobacterium Phage Nergal]